MLVPFWHPFGIKFRVCPCAWVLVDAICRLACSCAAPVVPVRLRFAGFSGDVSLRAPVVHVRLGACVLRFLSGDVYLRASRGARAPGCLRIAGFFW